ncbi:putative receptor-like protein kinase [Forsythia ovata]|uniref:Receptor-like protein kinase n=1 Tax=Forsythia ovata TaxID=205694 RepID=A0ABD1VNQ7_9LAMI
MGGIPLEIGNLSQLEIFSIRGGSLTGQVPSLLFNMSSLKIIDLAVNSLSGSLSVDIHRNLPQLELLYLHSNQLSGQTLSSLLDAKHFGSFHCQITNLHFGSFHFIDTV